MDIITKTKFRAWDYYHREMIYSDNLDNKNEDIFRMVNSGEPVNDAMQFIGLKDKNKKEIYVGDILNVNDSTDTVIPYYIKSALPFIELVNKNGETFSNGDYYAGDDIQCHHWNGFEVIGNIFESPELLK